MTEQVGWGRTVDEGAVELGCDWHTVNDTVIAYSTALVDGDPDCIGTVSAHRGGRSCKAYRCAKPIRSFE